MHSVHVFIHYYNCRRSHSWSPSSSSESSDSDHKGRHHHRRRRSSCSRDSCHSRSYSRDRRENTDEQNVAVIPDNWLDGLSCALWPDDINRSGRLMKAVMSKITPRDSWGSFSIKELYRNGDQCEGCFLFIYTTSKFVELISPAE